MNTDQLLAKLQTLCQATFVNSTPKKVKMVELMRPHASETQLNTRNFPAILIWSEKERMEQGPAANMGMRIHSITFRIIARSVDPNYFKKVDASPQPNIFTLSEELRDLLLLNKKILDTSGVWGLNPLWNVKDFDILHNRKSGYYNGRDIKTEFRNFEAWTGQHNVQKTNDLPQGVF